MRRGRKSAAALGVSLALVGGAAALGARFTAGGWYQSLEKPAWTPPAWVFGPAWTTLYVLMAVAAWRIWRKGDEMPVAFPLALYGGQLALNAAWSPVFFGAEEAGAGLAIILVLSGTVAATATVFRTRDRVAGALLLPYLGWVLYATSLNAGIVLLNRS